MLFYPLKRSRGECATHLEADREQLSGRALAYMAYEQAEAGEP